MHEVLEWTRRAADARTDPRLGQGLDIAALKAVLGHQPEQITLAADRDEHPGAWPGTATALAARP